MATGCCQAFLLGNATKGTLHDQFFLIICLITICWWCMMIFVFAPFLAGEENQQKLRLPTLLP